MASLDVPSYPPPPPPKRPVRPKITLQIPDAPAPMTPRTASAYWTGSPRFPKAPGTPGSHMSDPHGHPYFHPFGHLYHSKASEFMFKQFEGFKDFTINSAKSGLSAGEKSAFWFYNKLRVLSKRWFTHLFLTFSLALYSLMGAAIFTALESGHEDSFDRNLTSVRREMADKIMTIIVTKNLPLQDENLDLLTYIEEELEEYETGFMECMKNLHDNNTTKKTWSFWNSMFYAGTIYTTIVNDPENNATFYTETNIPAQSAGGICIVAVMSEENSDKETSLTLKISINKEGSPGKTTNKFTFITPDVIDPHTMETEQNMSIRKRRNLSKNRGQAARQREKTPEPNRTPIPHEDTPTSEDEEYTSRDPREAEADDTYEEMKRLVEEKSKTKDPVYDLDTDEILEARAVAQNDRRRRSISPFAVQDKEHDEASKLERKGSFIDPTNKLLSTNYTLSPKDDSRRGSLTIEPPKEQNKSLSPPSSATASPREKEFPYPMPSAPKKQEQMFYPDEQKTEPIPKKPKTPVKKEEIFTFDDKDVKQSEKQQTKSTLKAPETPSAPGELVTKVIQLERSPSKKLTQDKKPAVEIRERVVRTPSRKSIAEAKPTVVKQLRPRDELQPQSKVPPVKPARSKSATRLGNKTSESEMSEDQVNQTHGQAVAKRKVVPTPRRFQRNRSPKPNRSQSMNRGDIVRVIDRVDKTGTGMSQTSREIIELMQNARARSLSIPKDDPRLPAAYKNAQKSSGKTRELKTPNKTPSTLRQTRGISCPKTIQIIPNKEILAGISNKPKIDTDIQKHNSRQSSGYVDASQSEYTSSCYSSSPSENEYEFDLSERTAELTRKLNILSQEVDMRETVNNSILASDETEVIKTEIEKPALRKRSVANTKTVSKKEVKETRDEKAKTKVEDKKKEVTRSRWRVIANWQQFKIEQNIQYESIRLLGNRCVCDMFLLIIFCGLGGMMFKHLEGSFENTFKCGSRGMKRDFIESLWRGSHYLREEDWKSMARTKLFEFENQLHTAHEAGVTSYSGQRSWNFMNSFVYCMTLVTTIGYGHIAPKTFSGRVATIAYAIIGIPLFLIVLADFGKLFTRIIKFFWAFIRRFYYTRSCRKVRRTVPVQEVMKGLNIVYDVVRRPSQIFSEEDQDNDQPPEIGRKPSDVPPPLPPKPGQIKDLENNTEPDTPAPSVFEIDDEFNLPISVAIVILIIYIVIGAAGFNLWEKWDFFESFYFVFISMSTIGLGDFVPDHPMFMMASILYLIFGLALTSMCINVVQVKLTNTFRKASAKLGATIGLKVAEEDGSLVPNTPPATEDVPVHKNKPGKEEKTKETDENSKENNDNGKDR